MFLLHLGPVMWFMVKELSRPQNEIIVMYSESMHFKLRDSKYIIQKCFFVHIKVTIPPLF
jgi:hypothetical protein